MQINKFSLLAGGVLLALAGCSSTVKIGHVAPMSGPLSHLGADNENGARMAIEELNARGVTIGGKAVTLELVTADDAADPRAGVAAAKRLVDVKVNGVVGHLNSGTTLPASRVYFQAGIPQISPSATNPVYTRQGFNTTFRIAMDDAQLAGTLAHYAVPAYHLQRVVVIDDSTAYGRGMATTFANTAKDMASDLQIVAVEHIPNNNADFHALLARVAATAPDAVFFGGMDEMAGPMLYQMRELGIRPKFIGGDGICTQALPRLAGNAIDDGQVLCGETGAVADQTAFNAWKAKYRARFGSDVQVYAPHTYDAVMVMVEAMQQANSSDPKVYLPTLSKIRHHGITGDIEFDARGDNKDAAATIYTYRNGMRSEVTVAR